MVDRVEQIVATGARVDGRHRRIRGSRTPAAKRVMPRSWQSWGSLWPKGAALPPTRYGSTSNSRYGNVIGSASTLTRTGSSRWHGTSAWQRLGGAVSVWPCWPRPTPIEAARAWPSCTGAACCCQRWARVTSTSCAGLGTGLPGVWPVRGRLRRESGEPCTWVRCAHLLGSSRRADRPLRCHASESRGQSGPRPERRFPRYGSVGGCNGVMIAWNH